MSIKRKGNYGEVRRALRPAVAHGRGVGVLRLGNIRVGVQLEPDDQLHIEAPFGLADLFALRVVPNPYRKTVGFDRASADVRRRWPEVGIYDEGSAESMVPK